MAKTLHSSWYRNGEDVIFTDEAFHDLAYRITTTYQRVLAEMEQEHGEHWAGQLARSRGWRHDREIDSLGVGQVFTLPGYQLSVRADWYENGKHYRASITFTL